MNDLIIRKKLKEYLYSKNRSQLLIDELSCCQGAVRIDLASINDSLHWFEIKSEVDTLSRLPMQSLGYNYIFETLTIVTCSNHVSNIKNIVPNWWGIWVADGSKESIRFIEFKEAQKNPNRDAFLIASLLWKEEAKKVLMEHTSCLIKNNMNRYDLWEYIAQNIPIDKLNNIICEMIKVRGDWRSAAKRVSNGDLCRHVAKSQNCRSKLYRSHNPQYIYLPS